MAVRSIGLVGRRTERLEEAVAHLRDVIGVPITRKSDDLAGFALADGAVVELYGPGDTVHAFFTTGPVVGFRVEDFDATRAATAAAGVAFIGRIQHSGGMS